VRVRSPKLAIEDPRACSIAFDGKPVSNKPTGWWVDEAIRTVALPSFGAGSHLLELAIPMRRRTNVEWCYLLGDFGVRLRGRRATLTAPVRQLRFSDWTMQGLPFYAGNVTYHLPIRGAGRETFLRVPEFTNPLLVARLDGRRVGPIAFAPYRIRLGRLRGPHRLDLTAYGNRHNAFGPLHHANRNLTWIGPSAWRSTGEAWTDEYVLKPMGVLRTPVLAMSDQW
jgi:hypothetical protein